ncbi:T-cell surface glycoprotein CD3 zeta chain-like [Thalassophryne amazonica]|uniref:T-cell surface glycoprotein CD3 zeta chain-like n=1 Tax=Thalassophryne amazonica TaxID=390379 RepID=UPI0014724E9F|nr:T-cell surface glycoprotein CD3 zeta chain-like [Thalassophryne amazonica]
MELLMWVFGLLAFASMLTPAEAMMVYDPQMCFILDGVLGLYGLIVTGMFIKERFFTTKLKGAEESTYADLKGQDTEGYTRLMTRDVERGRNRRAPDDNSTYTDLKKHTEGEYKELPVRGQRHRKNEQLYQGLNTTTRDTYDSLQMQQLPAR